MAQIARFEDCAQSEPSELAFEHRAFFRNRQGLILAVQVPVSTADVKIYDMVRSACSFTIVSALTQCAVISIRTSFMMKALSSSSLLTEFAEKESLYSVVDLFICFVRSQPLFGLFENSSEPLPTFRCMVCMLSKSCLWMRPKRLRYEFYCYKVHSCLSASTPISEFLTMSCFWSPCYENRIT